MPRESAWNVHYVCEDHAPQPDPRYATVNADFRGAKFCNNLG